MNLPPKTYTVDPKAKHLNTRSVALTPFIERINADRKKAGYKPYTDKYIATCMSHIKTDELQFFYEKLCKEAKSFGALWNYYCKPKKV